MTNAIGGFLTWYVVPYSLGWVLIPLVHDHQVADGLKLALGVPIYLLIRQVTPPNLSFRQMGAFLLLWAFASLIWLAVSVLMIHVYYGAL